MTMVQVWGIVLGVLIGSMGTGLLTTITLGNRITRLETLVAVIADKLEVKA